MGAGLNAYAASQSGGGGSVTVQNNSSSSTDVSVNPEIVTINEVNFDSLREMIMDLNQPSRQAQEAAELRLEKVQDDTIATMRLMLAGAGLLFVLVRKGVV